MSRRSIKTLKAVLVLSVFVAVIAAGMTVLIPKAREMARASACNGKLYKLSLALGEYYHQKRAFPPRYGRRDDGGQAPWLDLFRPYLTDSYGRDDRAVYVRQFFSCPAHDGSRPDYLHIVGSGTLFDGTKQLGATQVYDGVENTLLIIEAPDLDAPGVADGELDIADLGKLTDSQGNIPGTTIHAAGRGMIFADGLVFRLVKPLPESTMRALMTAAGQEDAQRSKLVAEGYLVPSGGREIAH